MRSGWPRYRWFGPPATELREFALCLRCGAERSPDEQPLSWTDALRAADHPIDAA
jgi:hypothetical protein